MKISFLFLLVLFATTALASHNCSKHKPIVVIPGIMATILDGSSNGIPESFKMPSYCLRAFKERRFWIAAEEFLPGVFQCWKAVMRLYWNNATKEFEGAPKFDVTIPKFGNFYAIETVDPDPIFSKLTNFMGVFKKHFVTRGYVDGKDLNAAGTDWRNVPSASWIADTKALIEETYQKNGNTKVVILGHSMGSPFAYNFLRSQTAEWQKKYIDSFVAAAGPWSGAPKSISVMFRGMKDYLPFLEDFLLDVARSLGGLFLLLPRPEGFPENAVLAQTPNRNYSFAEAGKLLADAGMDDALAKAALSRKYAPDYDKPFPFETVCISGKGKKTQGGFVWNKPIVPGKPEGNWTHPVQDVYVDGDETVPLSSSKYLCERWGSKNIVLDDASHIGMLKDARFLNAVEEYVCLN